MKVAASSLSIGLQMNAPSGIGQGSIRSGAGLWAVGCGLGAGGWTNTEERFGSVRFGVGTRDRIQSGARAGLWVLRSVTTGRGAAAA